MAQEPKNLQDVATKFPWLRKQIDALYRRSRITARCIVGCPNARVTKDIGIPSKTPPKTPNKVAPKMPNATMVEGSRPKGVRCPNCNGRAFRLYGTKPCTDDPGYVWQDAECFPCYADFMYKVKVVPKTKTNEVAKRDGNKTKSGKVPNKVDRPKLVDNKMTYAGAVKRLQLEQYKLGRVAGEFGKMVGAASPKDVPSVQAKMLPKIKQQAGVLHEAKDRVAKLKRPDNAVKKVKKAAKKVVKAGKELVKDAVLGEVYVGMTPVGKARLSAAVDADELRLRLRNTRLRGVNMGEITVSLEQPEKIPIEGGYDLRWAKAEPLSADNVINLAPNAMSEEEFYLESVANFRKEALSQPKEAKEWLAASIKVLATIPMRLKIETNNGTFRAKRDLETSRPYILSYLQLCHKVPGWTPTEKEQSIVDAAAMITALLPMIRSWRRARSGGKSTLKSSL
nr:MAG: hypothetical protein [Skomarfal virus 20]